MRFSFLVSQLCTPSIQKILSPVSGRVNRWAYFAISFQLSEIGGHRLDTAFRIAFDHVGGDVPGAFSYHAELTDLDDLFLLRYPFVVGGVAERRPELQGEVEIAIGEPSPLAGVVRKHGFRFYAQVFFQDGLDQYGRSTRLPVQSFSAILIVLHSA